MHKASSTHMSHTCTWHELPIHKPTYWQWIKSSIKSLTDKALQSPCGLLALVHIIWSQFQSFCSVECLVERCMVEVWFHAADHGSLQTVICRRCGLNNKYRDYFRHRAGKSSAITNLRSICMHYDLLCYTTQLIGKHGILVSRSGSYHQHSRCL